MTETSIFSKSAKYSLSIRVKADGFSFLITNVSTGEQEVINQPINELLPLTVNFRKAVEQAECLSRDFSSIEMLYETNRYTLIPLELFDDEQIHDTFVQTQQERENECVLYDVLAHSASVIIYGIEKTLLAQIETRFPDIKVHSMTGFYIEQYSLYSQAANGKRLFVNIDVNNISVFAYDGRQFLLANTFICNTLSDRLYYTLMTWKQLEFNQKEDIVYLSDNAIDSEYKEFEQELHQFITHIERFPSKEA